MKKVLLITGIAALVLCGCKNSGTEGQEKTTSPEEVDYKGPMLTGSDSDEHGCKASAGYTWSRIKSECIRVWEEGIKMYPVTVKKGEAVYGATVIMADDESKAELFINGEESSIWLMKFTEKDNDNIVIYSGREYKFFKKKGQWVLEYKGKTIYKDKA